MKLHLSTLVLAFALLLPSHAYAQSSSKVLNARQYNEVTVKQNSKITSKWHKYTAPDGSYTILHPQAPQEQAMNVMGMNAIIVTSSDSKNRGYLFNSKKILLINIDTSVIDIELLFSFSLENITKTTNSSIESQKNITYNGFPGKEVIIHSKDANYYAKVRYILDVKNAMIYQVMVISDTNNFDFTEAIALIDHSQLNNV